jgi:16S rRNA (cytidine1402-2'-O)-methyltransferase
MSPHGTEKQGAWLLPDRDKKSVTGGLYITATPIGNMRDITLRALDVLAAADLIVCEDTRVSGKLLSYYGLSKKLVPYNDHNADRQRVPILQALAEGQVVALISDAGMPLINDPGFKLVRDALEAGFAVTSLPGANAPLTALQLSGLPSDQFCFLGYLPPKTAGRKKALQEWSATQASLIAFETAPRLIESLEDILEVLGDREIAVTRELTKLYEEIKRGPVSELIAHYKKQGAPKGEIVLVIGPGNGAVSDDASVEKALRTALKTMKPSEAASSVAKATGRKRKELYTLALEIGDES